VFDFDASAVARVNGDFLNGGSLTQSGTGSITAGSLTQTGGALNAALLTVGPTGIGSYALSGGIASVSGNLQVNANTVPTDHFARKLGVT